MKRIREGTAGAARGMSDHELLAELSEQYFGGREDETYMRPAYKEILPASLMDPSPD